jgi:hypothetical protein
MKQDQWQRLHPTCILFKIGTLGIQIMFFLRKLNKFQEMPCLPKSLCVQAVLGIV